MWQKLVIYEYLSSYHFVESHQNIRLINLTYGNVLPVVQSVIQLRLKQQLLKSVTALKKEECVQARTHDTQHSEGIEEPHK